MSYKLQRRRKYLSTILLFLNRLQATITFRKDDIEEIVFNLADDELAPLKNAENNYYEKQILTVNYPI